MERDWSGNARRLRQADRAGIERRIWSGETFAAAAAAVGCPQGRYSGFWRSQAASNAD